MASSHRLLATKHEKMAYIKEIFCKDYGVDMEEYLKIKEDLKKQGPDAHFVDELFPPNRESLCQNWDDITDKNTKNSWSTINWLRPKQFLNLKPNEQIKLFDNIEPDDIKQGLLGDCYFLSSLSSLAERGNLIKRLFETKTYQENGLYSIWLNVDGEWKNMIIDDHIPCKAGKPVFTRANGNELWVMLLEKAYAKAYGSYYKIEGGNPAIALRDLTGAPYTNFDERDPNKMFEFLLEHDQNGQGDILTCYTESQTEREVKNDVGLHSGHAYSVLDVREIRKKDNTIARVLQIRNPWGKGEWQGEWSDKDTVNWNDHTMKQVSNFTRQEDGSFWIGVNDFCKYFEGVGACQLQDDAKYNSISFRLPQNSTQAVVKLNLLENSKHLTITLCQKDERHYCNNASKYQYSFSIFAMLQQESNGYKWIEGAFDHDRNIMLRHDNLPKGEYILLVEMMWRQSHHRNIVLSCYSDQETTFSFVKSGLEFDKLLQHGIKSYCKTNSLKTTEPSKVKTMKYNGEQIGRISGSDFGLLFFYYYNHSSSTGLYQKLNFTKLTGYSLPSGITEKENVEIVVPPQKELVLILKFNAINDYKTEYSFKAELKMMNTDQCPPIPKSNVYLEDIWNTKTEEVHNIEAKDRKLVSTNFQLGLSSVYQKSSVAHVLQCEVSVINFIISLIAPFNFIIIEYINIQLVSDYPLFLFRLTMIYGFYLTLFSFDNCNFFDLALIMIVFILFQSQVMTRDRLRSVIYGFIFSIISSIVWFYLYPNRWNSVDSQFDMLGKAWKYLIPILELVFISIKSIKKTISIFQKRYICAQQTGKSLLIMIN